MDPSMIDSRYVPISTPGEVAQIHIEPARGWVSLKLGELWEYHELARFAVHNYQLTIDH